MNGSHFKKLTEAKDIINELLDEVEKELGEGKKLKENVEHSLQHLKIDLESAKKSFSNAYVDYPTELM